VDRVRGQAAWLPAARCKIRPLSWQLPIESGVICLPRIGQSRAAESGDSLKLTLAEANREYEKRFLRIFIICATGKSVEEILANLRHRLNNDDATELREAAEQQRQIVQIRLRKWLAE